MPPGDDWSVEVHDDSASLDPDLLGDVERAARAALTAENAGPIVLSVALLDDAEITRLNREYLSHEGPTDVISFPLSQPGFPPVGDVYIGIDQARRQADENDVPFHEELLRLTIHGTLHILGWTHEEGDSAEMYLRQEEILRGLK